MLLASEYACYWSKAEKGHMLGADAEKVLDLAALARLKPEILFIRRRSSISAFGTQEAYSRAGRGSAY